MGWNTFLDQGLTLLIAFTLLVILGLIRGGEPRVVMANGDKA
jgi:hypothetical protein